MAASRLAMGKSRQNIIGQVNAGGCPVMLQMAQSRCARDKRSLGARFDYHLTHSTSQYGPFRAPPEREYRIEWGRNPSGKTTLDQSYLLTRHL